ncbi:MAG: hypothetical protein ACOH17_05830 [Cellulomonas sp.]
MVQPTPVDRVAYLQLRRRARVASGSFLVVGVWLFYRMARLASGPTNPLAIIPFLALAALGVLASVVLRRMWRHSFAARPVTLRLDPDTGEFVDPAAAEEPPRRHRTFTGEAQPPQRW